MDYHIIIDSFIGPWAYSKQYVRYMLKDYKNIPVNVKITSLGGNVDHALDIRQQFIDHGDVTVYLSGFVASAATIIAMGAKRVVMSKYAMFLVHKCSNFLDVWGSYNADQMQKLIDELEANKKENDKIDVVLANMYANKCKKPVKDILNILKEGRWLSAQEALDLGFIDEIADPGETDRKLNYTADVDAKFNALGLSTLGLSLSDAATTKDENKGLLNKVSKVISSVFGSSAGKENKSESNTKINTVMNDYDFTAVGSLLKLDSITPDANGNVSVTAAQFKEINDRLASLDKEAKSFDGVKAAKEKEIEELKAQIENLKHKPGEDTTAIKEDGDVDALSANDLYNIIKSAI